MLEGRWTLVPRLAVCFGLSVTGMLPPALASNDISSTGRKVVAAGFGFQNAESSSITVKTYDAETGEVLSDDTYELDIKEEVSAAVGQPRDRVFAGGVGLGSDGLSEFTLRVYDAANGRFLWEGRLNLSVAAPTDSFAVKVLAQVRPRLVLRPVSQAELPSGQPFFYIRAVDPETGQVMWADQFSTDGSGPIRAERIGHPQMATEPVEVREIDFRIRMFDGGNRLLLWEDRVTPAEVAEGPEAGSVGEAAAGFIPGASTVWEADSAEI